jgi:ribose-phosphate pyrophosphokinase
VTKLLVVPMPQNETMAAAVARGSGEQAGVIETRHFPDGETWLRYATDPNGCNVAIVCTLDRPDGKFLPLLFAAKAARELGAKRVGLIAPYLAYMRQDRRFRDGEAITSRYFADLISGAFDWLVTVDPHLHRHHALSELYPIPARAGQAAPLIAAWIRENVRNPILIGPDQESEQWVAGIAEAAHAPFITLQKVRRGDRDVEIRVPDNGLPGARTPVIVDDIISSGETMLATVRQLVNRGGARPVCIAIHGIFAGDSAERLADAGATVITSNTVAHPTNNIDITEVITSCIGELEPWD